MYVCIYKHKSYNTHVLFMYVNSGIFHHGKRITMEESKKYAIYYYL